MTRVDSEFRKLAADEKQCWEEISPLLEEVADIDRVAFLRLKTMLEKVRNTDIYLGYWNMVGLLASDVVVQKNLPAAEDSELTQGITEMETRPKPPKKLCTQTRKVPVSMVVQDSAIPELLEEEAEIVTHDKDDDTEDPDYQPSEYFLNQTCEPKTKRCREKQVTPSSQQCELVDVSF